jgi:hypothetical protein
MLYTGNYSVFPVTNVYKQNDIYIFISELQWTNNYIFRILMACLTLKVLIHSYV